MEKGTLVLTRSDIQNALSLAEYLPVIEEAHALHAQGKVYAPDLLHADAVSYTHLTLPTIYSV